MSKLSTPKRATPFGFPRLGGHHCHGAARSILSLSSTISWSRVWQINATANTARQIQSGRFNQNGAKSEQERRVKCPVLWVQWRNLCEGDLEAKGACGEVSVKFITPTLWWCQWCARDILCFETYSTLKCAFWPHARTPIEWSEMSFILFFYLAQGDRRSVECHQIIKICKEVPCAWCQGRGCSSRHHHHHCATITI